MKFVINIVPFAKMTNSRILQDGNSTGLYSISKNIVDEIGIQLEKTWMLMNTKDYPTFYLDKN